MNNISLILLAGGKGTRMKRDIPKQFLMLGGKPIIMHSLEKADKLDIINEIVIVCHFSYIKMLEDYIKSYMIKTTCKIIGGGETRQESVYKGLNEASNDVVIIHEAARPFVKKDEYQNLIKNDNDNVIFCRRIPFTVIKGDEKVTGLLNRDTLYNVQLPQKFNKELLLDAHNKAIKDGLIFTEDASLLYYYEKTDITILEGTEYNIKLTDNIDLLIGEIIYKEYIIGRDI